MDSAGNDNVMSHRDEKGRISPAQSGTAKRLRMRKEEAVEKKMMGSRAWAKHEAAEKRGKRK